MFAKNVGNFDRGARIILGLALIAGFFANGDGGFGWLYLVGGAIALATGAMGSCAVYSLLGVNTSKRG